LHGILKKKAFGLDGKNSFKNTEEVDFQFQAKKMAENTRFWATLNSHNLKTTCPLGLKFSVGT
jgi:hypothetical protein